MVDHRRSNNSLLPCYMPIIAAGRCKRIFSYIDVTFRVSDNVLFYVIKLRPVRRCAVYGPRLFPSVVRRRQLPRVCAFAFVRYYECGLVLCRALSGNSVLQSSARMRSGVDRVPADNRLPLRRFQDDAECSLGDIYLFTLTYYVWVILYCTWAPLFIFPIIWLLYFIAVWWIRHNSSRRCPH